MLEQSDFNKFVEHYNDNYMYLLTRASHGDYACLLSSFTVLKDLYDVIIKLHETVGFELRVVPYSIDFRGKDELLRELGFNDKEIENIYGLLEYVKGIHGKEFEECISAETPLNCIKKGAATIK